MGAHGKVSLGKINAPEENGNPKKTKSQDDKNHISSLGSYQIPNQWKQYCGCCDYIAQ